MKLITTAVGATTRDKTLGHAGALRRAMLAMIARAKPARHTLASGRRSWWWVRELRRDKEGWSHRQQLGEGPAIAQIDSMLAEARSKLRILRTAVNGYPGNSDQARERAPCSRAAVPCLWGRVAGARSWGRVFKGRAPPFTAAS